MREVSWAAYSDYATCITNLTMIKCLEMSLYNTFSLAGIDSPFTLAHDPYMNVYNSDTRTIVVNLT